MRQLRTQHQRQRLSVSESERSRLGSDADADSELGGKSDAREVLFNGLINEKTIVIEPSPVSESYERLCPSFDYSTADQEFHESKQFVVRLCQEIFYKVRSNNYRINYEPPFIATFAHDFVWEPDSFDIYLPIRLPPGVPLRIQPEEAPGFIGIKIPASKKKRQATEKDPLDFLKSPKRYVSSAVSLKSTWKLVNNAMQQMSAKYAENLIIQELSLNKEENVIDVSVAVSSRYMETRLTSPVPGKQEQKADSEEEEEEDLFAVADGAFALHHDDVLSDLEEENELNEANDVFEDTVARLDTAELTQRQQSQLARGRRRKEPPTITKLLKLRICPAVQHPSDEHAFLTSRPFSFLATSNADLWSVQYPLEESSLIDSLTRADRGLRVRAWRGVCDFCRAQTELRCITKDMLKHTMLHLAESEVDLVGIRWQRAALAHYISDLLSSLRDHLRSAKLAHFFYKDVNVIQGLQLHQMRSAALKIDFFLRKDTALVRAVERTISSLKQADSNSHSVTAVSNSGPA